MRTLLTLLLMLLAMPAWAADEAEPVEVAEAEAEVSVEEPAGEESADEDAAEAEEPAEQKYQPGAEKQVFVYQDGFAQCFATDEEWEFYEVECPDIWQGNRDLMREVSACGSEGNLTFGGAVRSASNDPQVAITGPSPEGPVASGGWRRRTNGRGDWQELEFEFAGPESFSSDYSRDTLRGNWDLSGFHREGNVLGLRSDDDADPRSHTWDSGPRERGMGELNYRNGSAEGGSWRMNVSGYDTEIGAAAPPQVDDSRLLRFEVEGRLVECRTTLEGAAFAGSYRSQRARLDNDFSGVRFDGSQRLGERLELLADGSVTRIDAGMQQASATRSNYSASLGWDMSCDVRLSAFMRGYRDEGEISAASTLRDYSDTGARLDYRPDGDTFLSATVTRREANTERLQLENIDLAPYYEAYDPYPTRADLAGLRTAYKPSGSLLDIEARHRWSPRFYAGAAFHSQDYDDLPEAAELLGDLNPSPFADRRRQASLHAAYDLCDLGNLTFRTDLDQRRNRARGTSYERDQYSLGYTAPLCRDTQLGLGVTRQTTHLDSGDAEPNNNFDGSGWNYALNLSGNSESDCIHYVVSLNHAVSDGHLGGDFDSLGLELSFDSPWRVSAWWRRWDEFLSSRNAEDLSVQVGYRVDL